MDEVSLSTLLLSGECDVQWGSRGTLRAHRTVELHSNNILYCFEEPRNSMAKHIREKVYVEGCHIVDGGVYSDTSERLLLFLANYDYAEKVDLLGNHRCNIFAEERTTHDAPLDKTTQSALGSSLPSANYVVQLFMPDKMIKWYLLQAIQRASKEYPQLFPATAAALVMMPTPAAGSGSVHSRPSTVAKPLACSVANQFASKILGQHSVDACHTRTESDVTVLRNHEVLQLSDVLHEYEALQLTKSRANTIDSHSMPREGEGRMMCEALLNYDTLGSEVCVAANEVNPVATLSEVQSSALARLEHSPLYESCIKSQPTNRFCADCGEPFPSWCILQPFGAFVCIQCIGVHRKLWSSKCRAAELDRWPHSDVEFMKSRGNDAVNDELEYYVAFPADSIEFSLHKEPVVKPVRSFSSFEVRESFIRWKYEEQLFTQGRHPGATGPLPPRPDPVGLERSRLASATAASEGEGNTSDVSFGIVVKQQPSFLHDPGPPRYAGLLDIIVKELIGPESIVGAVCVLTNGFQTLRTRESRQLLHMQHSTAWDEHLQLGIEGTGQKPLYCTIHRGKGELLAAAEVWMTEEVFQPGTNCMLATTLLWTQLHRKPNQRTLETSWKITFLTSYRLLA
ncbi:hypothetical protein JKF63_01029 [Porcisia hertigi]|uniref:Arf-GAP domain-containing protein n=1 Tax=Porcisia hertigi TaxID=2761500 RepID=A0A836HFQ9_9TRYP|nr:hypothetical protein JKF63_01029 [Porcisia hertigi]